MKRSHVVHGMLSTLSALTVISACADVDVASPPTEPPLTTRVASERSTAELGVATWEIRADGAQTRVTGRDAASAQRVDLIIRRDAAAPDDRVQIEAVFPERGELQLTRDGLVGDPSSEYLRRLGNDVLADLGQSAASVVAGGGLDATNSAFASNDPRVNYEGTIHVDWGLFGHGMNVPIGGPCRPGTNKDRVEISVLYPAFGSATFSWNFLSSPTDCSGVLSMSVAGDHWDDFTYRLFNRRVNLTPSRPTSQSSTPSWGGNAARAIDGITNGNWFVGSVTHTDLNTQAWWQVDLGTSMTLGSVVLFNRTDCCSDRLSDFDIWLSNNGIDWGVQPAAGTTGPMVNPTAFSVNAPGRFVRVQLRGTNYLSLAEVQVFVP